MARRTPAVTVAIAVALLAPAVATGKRTERQTAARAVVLEFRDTFDTAHKVNTKCRKTGRHRYTCRWANPMPDPGYHDYHGRAKVKISGGAGDARLYGTHCHFCRSGPPPKRIR